MIDDIRSQKPQIIKSKKQRFKLLHIVLILVISTIIYFVYTGFWGSNDNVDSEKLISAVGELITLPEGENPTIATVSDPAKLADQPFFAKAKEGDKVLIYTRHQKAILYRPSEGKLVEVADLKLDL